jgi:peptidyl-prolyl cis-trans isomerase SurA
MKLKIITLVFAFITINSYSQKDTSVLFKIDKKPVRVSEFKAVFEKNVELLSDENQKDVQGYLDLFINYKLKVLQAYHLKIDTTRTYKRELETYKNELIAPYLQDTLFLNTLIKDAYYRTKNLVNASHILINVGKGSSPNDTLQAYQKIMNARNEVLAGRSFEEIAKKYSDDKSAKINGGNLGYFSAFKMVYPFEKAAFTTKVGELSMPFKTRFGYHILKINDLKPSPGKIEVAHILITDKTSKGKNKIDSLYTSIQNGSDFGKLASQFSNDKSTKQKNGILPIFGIGRMPKEFEEVAFTLSENNTLSKPFESRFGWHIIQFIKSTPVQSFEKMKKELTNRVKASGGARMSDVAMLKKLKKRYDIVVHEEAKKVFSNKNIRAAKVDTLQQVLLTINEKKIQQFKFFDYIRNRRHKNISVLFLDFLDEEVLAYFKDNLVHTEPEYANSLKEYKEGLLIFELMQQKVWNKSSKDTLGLKSYFKSNLKKYNFSILEDNKGTVMNDYQLFLESNMIADLKRKHTVKVNRRTLKKLLNFYKEK